MSCVGCHSGLATNMEPGRNCGTRTNVTDFADHGADCSRYHLKL